MRKNVCNISIYWQIWKSLGRRNCWVILKTDRRAGLSNGVPMKFIARKGAPNIPLELIEAQETGNLVFFCGAGISCAAGLPGFAGLVNNVYDSLGEEKSDSEAEAIKGGLYDRALGLLEARIIGDSDPGVNLVRRAIIEELTIADRADLQNHKAILQLSKTANRKHRLVTTNVDHGFLKVDPAIPGMIDAAPKLPIPKPHKWTSVVHLHGIIDGDDPNGEQLIFTSGDFGSAYLTERWASKFVTELFSHFTVLFVGYSVNDPVIRYMTDAIAAERLRGYEVFKQPYVIAHTTPSQRSENESTWRAKGIEPVLYAYSHNNLYNTLKEWDNYVRDGLNAKARLVIKEAPVAPLPPYDQDPSVIKLIDVLSEKTRPNQENVTGYPARIFSELDNPPAPIEWLPVLHEKGLLSIARQSDLVYPVNPSPYESNLVQPNRISFQLWHWLLRHLENNTLIRWIIDHGLCLHPDLKSIIGRHINSNPPQEPYLRFWKIVTSDYVNCGRHFVSDGYDHIRALGEGIDQLALAELSELMEPSFKLSKSFDWSGVVGNEDDEFVERPPYEIEVVIGLSDWVYTELTGLDAYPRGFISMLLPATQALIKALEFWDFAGFEDELDDRSHWDMVSISPHPQNRRYRTWVILIELCRDLWETTWEDNKVKAQSVLDIWRSLKHPVFRRLTLHAMTVKDIANPDVIVDYLLEDNGQWLWSLATHREVFRLLAVLWPKLDEATAVDLVNTILQGPPREMYREDLTNEDWRRQFDRDVWLMLSKLQSFGGILPDNAVEALKQLTSEYPMWALQEGDRDEFTHWMETGVGHEVDITLDELFEKEVPDLVEFLSQEDRQYGEGRIDLFRVGCKDNREKAIEVLNYLAISSNWDKNLWHAGLVGLADSDENTWAEIAPLLNDAGPELYRGEPWPIAHWTKKNISQLECGALEERYFWVIFESLLHNVSDRKEPIRRAVNYAINHPVGIITEALMDRFGACRLKVDEGIPDGPLQECVNQLISSETQASVAGKIVLASRLHYFHAIDPRWAEENLIPLFDWEGSEIAAVIWQGYLRGPRISADLAIPLKSHLANAVKHADQIEVSAERLIQLFTVVCLEYSDLYTAKEQHDVLVDVGTDGLVHIAEFFWRSIGGDAKSASNYWRNRIQPFMKRAWPKAADFVSDETSEHLALMAIELDEAFEEALDFLWPFIKPFSDLSFLLTHLDAKELPDQQPREVLRLLSKVFTEEYQWPSNKFSNILSRIVQAEPIIENELTYRIMNDYLVQRNL